MVISLIIVTGSSPTLSADESLPQPVEDGSTYSSIRDSRRILRYIPIRPHQHRLAAYYLPCREMEARDPHISPPLVGMMDFQDPYMQWYRRITRRFLTPRLHRDDMRFHTTAGSMNVMVSRTDVLI